LHQPSGFAVNIVDAFIHQARLQPTALAACAPGAGQNVISYGRLAAFVNNVGRHALAAGLKRGDTVAIFADDAIFHLALVLGLTRIGVLTLSTRNPVLPTEFPINAVVTERPAVFSNVRRVLVADAGWIEGDGTPAQDAVNSDCGSGDAPARLVLTSGTTGDPKAVALSHENVIRRLQAYDAIFGHRFAVSRRTFLDVGLTTSFGYALTLHVLARGGAVFYRGADAAETMQAFGLYNVECMVGAPSGVAEFLGYYEQSPAFLCPFEVMLASGSLLSQSLSERVRGRMCSHLMATYAATEISPVAAAPAHHIAHIPGAVGYVAPWVNVQAVDHQDRPLKPGAEGLIRLRGHTLVEGYFGNPPGSETIFRDGWFYPGDIGTVTEDRLLIISGREKAVINLGGEKINPETVEMVLLTYPGIRQAAAAGVPNTLGVAEMCAAVVTDAPIDLQAVRSHCARSVPAGFVPVRIVRLPDIPRNEMGRIDRKRLGEILSTT
jgi:acyl-CoA synthetase (AMP-forming)/AMP-acid ligase II